ncbi:MAG: 3-oxoacyl-[acyl-carrier-protein] reductase [Candidatus Polarisedimenticolia bacterium]
MSGGGELAGRVTLVTGASRGIGRAVASACAARGSDLIVAARRREDLEPLRQEFETRGVRARVAVLDLERPESVGAAVEEALSAYGRIDHLVNNAGVTGDGLLMRMKRDTWDRVLQVNLSGAFETTRAVLPSMVRGRYGRIVNISSIVALMGNPGQTNYCAAKAGLIGFTKALAREVASRQITVNAVAPGLIDTDMTRALPEDGRGRMAAQIPLGRLGTPEDVAAAVVFLLGPGAAYVTGEVLNVSGGLYM